MKETIIYKNKNGKIVKLEDEKFGGTRYLLFTVHDFYVKDLTVPFKVSDYL